MGWILSETVSDDRPSWRRKRSRSRVAHHCQWTEVRDCFRTRDPHE